MSCNSFKFTLPNNPINNSDYLTLCSRCTNPSIFAIITNQPSNLIQNLEILTFDDVTINQNIFYENGIFTITESGIYIVDWSINVGGSGNQLAQPPNSSLSFTLLRSDNVILAKSLTPNGLPTQAIGMGLFRVTNAPIAISLINSTGVPINYTTDYIQGYLRIYQ